MKHPEKQKRIKKLAGSDGIPIILGLGAGEDKMKELLIKFSLEYKPTDNDFLNYKSYAIRFLSPHYSAVSVDLRYGYPACKDNLAKECGLILSAKSLEEMTSKDIEGREPDAIKFRINATEKDSVRYIEKQKRTAIEIGNECFKNNRAYILQVESYTRELPANEIPGRVIGHAKEFSEEVYMADILKIQFPASEGVSQAGCYCKEISDIFSPWVVIPGIRDCITKVEIATDNGASGPHIGRAAWGGAAQFYDDIDNMKNWFSKDGFQFYCSLYAASKNAKPLSLN